MYSAEQINKAKVYGKGYRDGYEDMRRRVARLRMDEVDRFDELDPDLAKLLNVALKDVLSLR